MARSNSFSFEFDMSGAAALADKLGVLSGETISASMTSVVDEVAARTEELVIDGMRPINLAERYVRSKIKRESARLVGGVVEAVIWSPFSRTPLGRYAPIPIVESTKNYAASRGNPSFGIRKGQKMVGVSVEVIDGDRQPIETQGKAFLMRLKNNNGIGVFLRRTGEKKTSHRYGPEVYQMLRVQADVHREDIGADLQATVIDFVQRKMQELT